MAAVCNWPRHALRALHAVSSALSLLVVGSVTFSRDHFVRRLISFCIQDPQDPSYSTASAHPKQIYNQE